MKTWRNPDSILNPISDRIGSFVVAIQETLPSIGWRPQVIHLLIVQCGVQPRWTNINWCANFKSLGAAGSQKRINTGKYIHPLHNRLSDVTTCFRSSVFSDVSRYFESLRPQFPEINHWLWLWIKFSFIKHLESILTGSFKDIYVKTLQVIYSSSYKILIIKFIQWQTRYFDVSRW